MTNAAATKENVLIRILAPAMGAEVIGMDLSKPMNEAEVASLRNELNKYGVLCFRDQVLTEAQQIDFSKRWGPLEDLSQGLSLEFTETQLIGKDLRVLARVTA